MGTTTESAKLAQQVLQTTLPMHGRTGCSSVGGAGFVTTVAGSGEAGSQNGAGTLASFSFPYSVAQTLLGNYVVTDTYNNLIRKINSAGCVIVCVVVLCCECFTLFVQEWWRQCVVVVLLDSMMELAPMFFSHNLLVYPWIMLEILLCLTIPTIDWEKYIQNWKIVSCSQTFEQASLWHFCPVITTIAGSGASASVNGIGSNAAISNPNGIAIDSSDNLFVVEAGFNKIRKLTTAGQNSWWYWSSYFHERFNIISGIITDLVGSSLVGHADGAGSVASFNRPNSIVFDTSGNLVVTDSLNHLIRKINPFGWMPFALHCIIIAVN
jgi:hypothetical protein